ncbi:hypothetical protein [Inconstantimicrobium mannanitabidum]|uniref:Uncharacterized protein n=1 Tax=Inconstantimicrobium mannanitabidum TaxID=1604901 RepID=A0ACB5RFR6_9CLOT|nr:hypothetical protein [Clostridium sp. TW13]GKX67934.1 hypothetical protein rsdtw13_31920 [Clostridium sp. TW13]
MNYFYVALLLECVFITYCIYKIVVVFKTFLKEKKKGYLILALILIPLATYLFCALTLPKIKDLHNAFANNLSCHEGTVEKKYISGHSFVLDGAEYQYNPWAFKPKEKSRYKLYYLPNSKFVIRYEEG